MENIGMLFKSKTRKAEELFVNNVLNLYHNGVDQYGFREINQVDRNLLSRDEKCKSHIMEKYLSAVNES